MRRAIECLEIAASPNADSPKGDADAQNMLGELFETGEGSEASTGPHMENAVAYYKRAVIQGHSRAMFNLACLYEQGNGVAHDISRAVKLHCEVPIF